MNPAHIALMELLYSGEENVLAEAAEYRRIASTMETPGNIDYFNLMAGVLEVLAERSVSR